MHGLIRHLEYILNNAFQSPAITQQLLSDTGKVQSDKADDNREL
jgi:hypothetical protein